ncbi:MAG TPA: copper resistance protein CopC [Candidatus Binataceae bacterium]|nr:copper resistance protein CopC [Candidatus Binataceae bacterium]
MKVLIRRALTSLLIALVAMTATIAAAHSFPEKETPPAGATLNAPPAVVSIKFDAPIERLFAQLQVLGADGKNEVTGGPEVAPDGYTLRAKIPVLKPGDYKVEWAVVCIDTHHTNGSYEFTVGEGGS